MTNEERQSCIDELQDIECDLRNNSYEGPRITRQLIAITAAIAALEREGQMEAQPSPDLEPVRRLIEAAADDSRSSYDVMWAYAHRAIPALCSLLAEVEKLREENAKLQDLVFKLGKLNSDMNKLFPIRCYSEPGSPIHDNDRGTTDG